MTTYLTWLIYKDGMRRESPPKELAEFTPINAQRSAEAAGRAALRTSVRDNPYSVRIGVVRADRVNGCRDWQVKNYDVIIARSVKEVRRC